MPKVIIERDTKLKKGAISAEILRILSYGEIELSSFSGKEVISALLPRLMPSGIGRKRANAVIVALERLRRGRLIELSTDNQRSLLKITSSGEERLKKYELQHLSIREGQKWDGRWRIVLFDIPEHQKITRDRFTRKLKALGFMMLKGGVFLHYLPCKEEIASIAEQLTIEKRIAYIEAISLGEIENDVKDHFSL